MSKQDSREPVVLSAATRDFLLQALGEATDALSRTHRLRATTHILVEEGVLLTPGNSFLIDHRDPLLLMSLARMLLQRQRADDPPP